MLVVLSDLHLTDGTSGSTLSAGALQLLAGRLADLAASASMRADGSYRPIQRIDLVLLGDVLDVIRSRRWLESDVRPWDDPQLPAVADTVTSITGAILRHNDAALSVLRALARGMVRLTPCDSMGRRAAADDSASVPVRIHYLVGNSDWLFHLPGQQFDRLRRQLVVHMGLANEPDMPFPHEPWESHELLQAVRRHRVLARHGDVFDPLSFDGQRDASSIGDLITVELIGRFAGGVEGELAHELPARTLAGLRELGDIRPLVLVPAWLEKLLERTCPSSALRHRMKCAWDGLADAVLEHPFLRQGDAWRPRDLVDGLAQALKFGRRTPSGWTRSTHEWLCSLRGATSASFANHALAEEEFRNRRARHVVYGHTHRAEESPLEASYADGYVLCQTYFNAGTWRRVYQPAQFAAGGDEFIASDALTFLTFYQGDERGGRPYETWTGTLGINANESLLGRRVDAAVREETSIEPSAAAPPPRPIRAPHFGAAPTIAASFSTSEE